MKYTVFGFDQAAAVDLGIDTEGLSILRWFLDFWQGDMRKTEINGLEYGYVSYGYVLEELPILSMGHDNKTFRRVIARKFQKLVKAGVLEHKTLREKGVFAMYRPGPKLPALIPKKDYGSYPKRANHIPKKDYGLRQKYTNKNPSINNQSTKIPQNGASAAVNPLSMGTEWVSDPAVMEVLKEQPPCQESVPPVTKPQPTAATG